MMPKDKFSSLTASGLRTRFFPKSRLGHGLISVAPWINVVLLIFFFLMIDRKFLLEPGILVNLPKVSIDQGSSYGMTAVVLSLKGAGRDERDEIVFFDDVRYRLQIEDQRKRLQRAFSSKVKEGREVTLILQADRNVSHGTVVDLMNMALAAGVDRVNIAAKQ